MVKVVIDLTRAQQKLSPESRQKGQYALANQFLSSANQYVPMKDNILRMSGTIDLDGSAVNWNTPYAKPQFYGFVGKGYRVYNYTTPGTSRRWDLRTKANHMRELQDAYLKGAGF